MVIIVPHWIIWSYYTGCWWVGCYIWYSEEGTRRGHSLPKPFLAVPNVTAYPSTASVPITVLLYTVVLRFYVPIKGQWLLYLLFLWFSLLSLCSFLYTVSKKISLVRANDEVLIKSLYQSATELVQTFNWNFIVSTKIHVYTTLPWRYNTDVVNTSFPLFYFRAS